MPDNIDKALSMTIVVTNAEKEEKALGREDRGTSAKVFTVGGNRIIHMGIEIGNPEEKSNGVGIEVPGSSIDLDQLNTRCE
jgi:hypothetical protein